MTDKFFSVQKQIKQSEHLHHQNTVKGNEGSDRLPSILPRASADCFLLELEHIRLLCKKDHCIVLEPAKKVIKILQIITNLISTEIKLDL